MRCSDIGSFGFQWRNGLLPFLLVEQIDLIILLHAVIARCAKVEKTSQMSVALFLNRKMYAVHISGLSDLWIQPKNFLL